MLKNSFLSEFCIMKASIKALKMLKNRSCDELKNQLITQ